MILNSKVEEKALDEKEEPKKMLEENIEDFGDGALDSYFDNPVGLF